MGVADLPNEDAIGEVIASHLENRPPGIWTTRRDRNFIYLDRSNSQLPQQGWKLHVSATPDNALEVLEALLPVLLAEALAFKVIKTRERLRAQSSAHAPRGSSGKFVTIYPRDDAEALQLARLCHEVTSGLEGPAILSDRRYAEGGIVYYRYGAFFDRRSFQPDGSLIPVIQDGEGRLVPDNRDAWFTPPTWLEDPFLPTRFSASAEPTGNLALPVLGDRFALRGVIRHANKGGVYEAFDQTTGDTVILKEARPLVGTDHAGRDARAYLRAEYENLHRLHPLGVVPRPYDLFEQGGHLFLAVEKVDGQSLMSAVATRRRQDGARLPAEDVRDLIEKIAEIVFKVHGEGLVIRDLSPNNLMWLSDGRVLLIDPEMAGAVGETELPGSGGGTPGYVSPEQLRGEPAGFSDDYYSLGALLLFLATAREPFLLEDRGPGGRSYLERLRAQMKAMEADEMLPAGWGRLVAQAMDEDPERRLGPAEFCSELRARSADPVRGKPLNDALPSDSRLLDIVADICADIVERFDFDRRDRPLEASCLADEADPINVQYGVAGVGSFLLRVLPDLDDPHREEAVLRESCSWMTESLDDDVERPPGLYFGVAGAAWFLLDAGLWMRDRRLTERAERELLAISAAPELLDITHGASGIGLACLHFHRTLGTPMFLDHAIACADRILAIGRHQETPGLWPTPQVGAEEAGRSFYGFAHGTAGIGYFLLAANAASGLERFRTAAITAGELLAERVEIRGGRADWTHGPDVASCWPHWCNGASGVGTFLVRLFQVTGEERFRDLALAAAESVMAHKWWFGSVSQCHGVAGNGEFLLDLHQVLGDPVHLERARELAALLLLVTVRREGRELFSDESQGMISPDFGIGTAGIGAFLHRVATGGERMFSVASLFMTAASSQEELVVAQRPSL